MSFSILKNLVNQIGWFVIVGCLAAATHWLIAVICVNLFNVHPLLANLIGWLIAFVVSYTGHYKLTFRHLNAPLMRSALRFFMVSAFGFAINETAYAILLSYTKIPYDILLALVLIGIAIITFILSRYWAFYNRN